MTDEQKDKLLRLRRIGFTHREIADATGIHLYAVQKYCSRNKLAPGERSGRHCKFCGKEIAKETRPNRIFCSDKCRESWWNQNQKYHKKIQHHICPICGKEFDAYGQPNRIYCSIQCVWRRNKPSIKKLRRR